MRNAGNALLARVMIPLLVTCSAEKNLPENIEGTFRGYKARIVYNGMGRHINIFSAEGGRVSGTDLENNGQIDRINIVVPRGHNLIKYANPDSLERAHDELTWAKEPESFKDNYEGK